MVAAKRSYITGMYRFVTAVGAGPKKQSAQKSSNKKRSNVPLKNVRIKPNTAKTEPVADIK